VKQLDGDYSEEVSNCNGAEEVIVLEHKCKVLISDLIKAPYHLPWGSSVHATVMATNVIGDSLASADGNGAVILTVPEAPTML
jgi:hypothetical protein